MPFTVCVGALPLIAKRGVANDASRSIIRDVERAIRGSEIARVVASPFDSLTELTTTSFLTPIRTGRIGFIYTPPIVFELVITGEEQLRHFYGFTTPPPAVTVTVAYDAFTYVAAYDSDLEIEYLVPRVMERILAELPLAETARVAPSVLESKFSVELVPAISTTPVVRMASHRNAAFSIGLDVACGRPLSRAESARELHREMSPLVRRFYWLLAELNEIDTLKRRLVENFGRLLSAQAILDRMSPFQCPRVQMRRRRARALAGRVHTALANYSLRAAEFGRARDDYVRTVRSHGFLAGLGDYVQANLAGSELEYDVFLGGLEHARARDLNHAQNRMAMWAAVVGAAIALAGGLFTTFMSSHNSADTATTAPAQGTSSKQPSVPVP